MSRFLFLTALLFVLAAQASPEVDAAQRAQLESLRAEVAGQLQLQAYDLLDELVYGWNKEPLFAQPTPVVLADVNVPVGFGSGLQALVENHLVGVLTRNPNTRVVLAHCPQCTAVMVHSGAKGTVVARGVDEPETLAKAGALAGSRHALFLDFEVEGAALVLRARVTELKPALPIVYARTLTTSTSSAALLRDGAHLKSAAEARQEYLDALQGRGLYILPIRLGVRTYSPQRSSDFPLQTVPFPWLSVGAEASLTHARAWTAGLSLGISWVPDAHVGVMAQGRISRLLTGSVSSLTHPDLYAYLGASVVMINGRSAMAFRSDLPTTDDVNMLLGAQPRSIFGAFALGLDLRVKNRIGVGVFVETLTGMDRAIGVGSFLNLGILQIHSIGGEVSFCF
ncbi:MAG: hypothetical protein ACT4TC_11565 [Myxococcaceae bacterium]